MSLGLCLIEVLSGKRVFDDIMQDFDAFEKRKAGENPGIPVMNFGERFLTT